MEVQDEQGRPFIKIEPDDQEESMSDENGQNIPCISTVPMRSSADSDKVYYFPSQAVFTPRSSFSPTTATPRPQKLSTNLKAMNRWAQKRKTIEALAQGAILNVSQPMMFEELIAHANTKITLYDTKKRAEVPRPDKEKASRTTPSATVTNPNATTEITFPALGSPSYSIRSDENNVVTVGQLKRTVSLATVNPVTATTISNTPSMIDIYTHNPKTIGRSTENLSVATPARKSPISVSNTGPTLQITIAGSTNVLSNPIAPEPLNIPNQLASPILTTQHTPVSSSRILPSNSVRPEISKTAVCLPTNVSKTVKDLPSPSQIIYVPKEIKVAPTELKLDECVNVNAICDKELTKWTAEDVATFVRATDCSEYADAFIDQEIDGKALTLLNQELLIQWMKLKLGPAMKLYSHIVNLKHALHNAK